MNTIIHAVLATVGVCLGFTALLLAICAVVLIVVGVVLAGQSVWEGSKYLWRIARGQNDPR